MRTPSETQWDRQGGRDRRRRGPLGTGHQQQGGEKHVPKESSPGSGRDRLRGGRNPRWEGMGSRSRRQCGPLPLPSPQPAPWGRMGRGARGAVGRGPEYRFRGPHLLCSLQGEHGGVELDLPQLQPPPLFIPWPSPLGGQGCRHELSLLENPLREGVRGGGWIAQPLGHVVVRADPRALWIWGSPQLGVGMGADPEGLRNWI